MANGCEMMLQRATVLEQMAEENKGLWNIVKNWLKKWAAQLQEAFQGVSAVHDEARAVEAMEAERLRKFTETWYRGLFEASENAQKSPAGEGGEVKYSWGDAKGVANKKLSPITGELQKSLLSEKNNVIVDSHEKVVQMVNNAFDNKTTKETGYFGVIGPNELKKIQNKATNVAKELQGKLFKENKGYVLAVTSDSIRHLNEELKLSRKEIVELLDRLADIVLDNDTVKFSYYLRAKQKTPGLLFEKAFPDGSYGAFNLISGRRRRLGLQTMYIEGRDAKIEKSSLSSLPVNNPRPTSVTNGSRTLSDNSIRSSSEESKTKFQEREDLPEDRELLMAAKAEGRNAEALEKYQKKVKALEALERKQQRQQEALEKARESKNQAAVDEWQEKIQKTEESILRAQKALDDMERSPEIRKETEKALAAWREANPHEAAKALREMRQEQESLRKYVELLRQEAKLTTPEGFTVNVSNVKVCAGAGFIVAYTGDIMTMPGLPRVPAAERIDVDENGVISGLF